VSHLSAEELTRLASLGGELKGILMTAQQDIDNAVTILDAFLARVDQAAAQVENQGGVVDTSQLNAVVAQVPAVEAALNAAVPPPATTGTVTTTATTHTTSS